MANTHATLTDLFTDIADAIRTKTGKSGNIIADNFPDEIMAITAGEGESGGYTGDLYSFGTATAKPGSGATSAQFTNIPKQPDFFICYVDTFNVEQYHRAGVVVYDGETVYGQEIYSGTDDCYLRENTNTASSYYYKFSYSGTTLTISSSGTNNGGYFHNPGTYTLIYAYKDNENGTVAIDKKKVTATAGTSLSFTELEGEPVWYSAILKANQDAQAGSTSTVMYVNENGCTRMGNASSRAPYTFTAATGLGSYSDGTLTLTPGSANFVAREYTLIYAYVPTTGGGGGTTLETCAVHISGDSDDSSLFPKKIAYISVANGRAVGTSATVSGSSIDITCLKGSIVAVEYNQRISNDTEDFIYSTYDNLFSSGVVSVYKLKDDATTARINNTDMGSLA